MRERRADGVEWFFEEMGVLGEPEAMVVGLLPSREVYRGQTAYQAVEIFDNDDFGRVLALDGLIQLSTRHEAVYHEMLSHPALLSHPCPRRAAVIGGGDGGVLREILKHPVESVLLIDIDAEVIALSKQYLPEVNQGAFDDPRVEIITEDALKIIPRHAGRFDIVVVDSTDCYGPSEPLWQKSFFQQVSDALNEDGIAIFQMGFLKEAFSKRARAAVREIFAHVQVHRAFVRCYPGDESAFVVASHHVNLGAIPSETLQARLQERGLQTTYYSAAMHGASSVIPAGYDDMDA